MKSLEHGQGQGVRGSCHGGRCGEEPADGDEPQQAGVTSDAGPAGASPSNTPPHSSHEVQKPFTTPSVSIDWLECGGIIDVSAADEKQFFVMDQKMVTAQELNKPVELSLAGHSVLLFPKGIGSGKEARQTYRVEYGPAMLAFSFREAKDRLCANMYYKIPGTSCLIWGAWEIRRLFHQMLEGLGCQVVDEWPRRIDLCLDLPGTNWREKLKPAIDAGCTLGTFTVQSDFHVKRLSTGVKFQTAHISLRIYDKVQETRRREPEYQVAIVMNRWGGQLPADATRIELEFRGEWLRQHQELKDLDGVRRHLPDIVEKAIGDAERPFFRLTETPVDRENGHQSRVATHHVWQEYRDYWRAGLGDPDRPPKRLPRHMIDGRRAFACVKGYLTGDAARRGEVIQSLADAQDQLRKMHENNWASDEDWKKAWEEKARRFATLDGTVDFPSS